MKGLNLSALTQKTWELTLLDGTVLPIKKPSQGLLIQLEQAMKRIEAGNLELEDIFTMYLNLVVEIMNNNSRFKVFTHEEVDKMLTYDYQIAIITGYTEFAQEVMSNPN